MRNIPVSKSNNNMIRFRFEDIARNEMDKFRDIEQALELITELHPDDGFAAFLDIDFNSGLHDEDVIVGFRIKGTRGLIDLSVRHRHLFHSAYGFDIDECDIEIMLKAFPNWIARNGDIEMSLDPDKLVEKEKNNSLSCIRPCADRIIANGTIDADLLVANQVIIKNPGQLGLNVVGAASIKDMKVESAKVDRAARNIKWIEDNLYEIDGPNAGKPYKLQSMHKTILEQVYANDDDYTATVSVRKWGATTLTLMIALLHTVGPEAVKGTDVFIQSEIPEYHFNWFVKMGEASPALRERIKLASNQRLSNGQCRATVVTQNTGVRITFGQKARMWSDGIVVCDLINGEPDRDRLKHGRLIAFKRK